LQGTKAEKSHRPQLVARRKHESCEIYVLSSPGDILSQGGPDACSGGPDRCGHDQRCADASLCTGKYERLFWHAVDECIPLVAAFTASRPGKITVTYVSGTVTDAGGINTGPDGVPWIDPRFQIPLQEKFGVWFKKMTRLDGLIGVFVPQSRVQRKGFRALDGTKGVTRVGIMPDGIFFIGTGKTFRVNEAGTLFLGINDCWVSDNGGGFKVTVTGP
jgi:hypothetical protein